jgi:hypothetical protein
VAVYASIALESLPALCWCCLPHHAGIFVQQCSHCGIVIVPSLVIINWVCQRPCLWQLLPALHWHLCQHCAGVVFLTTLASLHNNVVVVALFCTRPCCHGLPLTTLSSVAVYPSIALASLPALCWQCPPHCTGIFVQHRSCCRIVVVPGLAVINYIGKFLPLWWSPLVLRWRYLSHGAGAFAVDALVSSPLSHWHLLVCNLIIACSIVVALVLLSYAASLQDAIICDVVNVLILMRISTQGCLC